MSSCRSLSTPTLICPTCKGPVVPCTILGSAHPVHSTCTQCGAEWLAIVTLTPRWEPDQPPLEEAP